MRCTLLPALFLVAVLLMEPPPASAAWKPDHKFQPEVLDTGAIRVMLVQSDGKVLVAGDFTSFDAVSRLGVARFNADGTMDTGFVPRFAPVNNAASYTVTALTLQPDGKILLAGYSANFNLTPELSVYRLNPDGSEDPTFSVREVPGSDHIGPSLNALLVQPDGKIIVAGDFDRVGTQECKGLVRLNADGSLDLGFGLQAGPNRYFTAVMQADGKVLAGGDSGLSRFDPDGALDSTYQPALPDSGRVDRMAYQKDGKLILAGSFRSGLQTRENILRLNGDGSLDPDFRAAGLPTLVQVTALTLDGSGQILVGGSTNFDSAANSDVLVRLGANGTADSGFSPDLRRNGGIQALAVQGNGQILVGGGFNQASGQRFTALVRLNADGTLDKAFRHVPRTTGNVYKVAAQPDGKLLLLGSFNRINDQKCGRLARLTAKGAPDPDFHPALVEGEYIDGLTLLPNGQILLNGQFDPVDGETTHAFARLNADGSRDRTFRSAVSGDYIDTVVGLPNGKFLVAAQLWRKNGKPSPDDVHRFNADGSRDRTFHSARVLIDGCNGLGVQSDGKIILAGKIKAHGQEVAAVVRLEPDGALDPSFTALMDKSDPYDYQSDSLRDLKVQSDDKVVVAGEIHHVNGVPCSGLIRLNADGSLDPTYRAGATSEDGLQDAIYDLVPLPGNRLFAVGWFTQVDGAARRHAALFEADGSLNAGFNPDSGDGGEIYAAAPVGGKLFVAGGFRSLDGSIQGSVARLKEKR